MVMCRPVSRTPDLCAARIDLAAIARYGGYGPGSEDAMFLYERSIDHDLPEDFFVRTVERYALLRRWQESGRWHAVVAKSC